MLCERDNVIRRIITLAREPQAELLRIEAALHTMRVFMHILVIQIIKLPFTPLVLHTRTHLEISARN